MIVGGLGFLAPQRQVYNDVQPKLSSRSVFAPVRPGDRRLNSKITSNAVLNLMAYGCSFRPLASYWLHCVLLLAAATPSSIQRCSDPPEKAWTSLLHLGLYVLAVLALWNLSLDFHLRLKLLPTRAYWTHSGRQQHTARVSDLRVHAPSTSKLRYPCHRGI
jgi:hypothetical protein